VTANPPGAGTPTGTVDFRDAGVSIAGCGAQALVAGTTTCAVTYAGVGSHTITAVYSGDANFNSSTSVPLTQNVNKDATTTSLSSSANPSVAGQGVTFTATVTANPPSAGTPTGSVTFQDGGVNIPGCVGIPMVGGVATCNDPPVGIHSITAVYSGDANFSPSTSAPLTQIVNQDATTTALSSSANPSASGQSVTYTATVTANPPGSGTPTGTVTFRDGGVDIAGCTSQTVVGGTATCGVTYAGVGTHNITGIYNGDPNFLNSTSVSVAELIAPGLPNTSGPKAGAAAARPIQPEGKPGIWLTILALIAGLGGLGMVAARPGRNRVRFQQRRRRPEFAALVVLLCLSLGTIGVSQLAALPMASSISSSALSGRAAIAGLPSGAEQIGSKVVSVAKPPPRTAESFHPATGPIVPSRLMIPSIGVDAQVVGVGLLSDGAMDVPDNLWTTAWLSSSARPGHPGSSVIAGHRGIGTPAVFSHLENVRPGDRIYVSDAAGGELVYQVTGVVSVDLSPSNQVDVFGPTATQQLVLITCFGKYSSSTGTYDHRLVVITRLLPPNS
jgi:LPXTG-site transpeptidase (sortase) family protein